MVSIDYPQSVCHAGIARGDITPPVGSYHRMWGAANHDRSTGVHRPLTATVLHIAACQSESSRTYIALDHCLLWTQELSDFLASVAKQSGVSQDDMVVLFSHTHAAGLMGWERESQPGGELIRGYLDDMATSVGNLVKAAVNSQQLVTIGYGVGHCGLARNRDFYDEESEQYVCGFNPDGITDPTLMVARITKSTGETVGTVVNYACHPTTLAWDNTLISPDFLGAMRETIESATDAPCFFVQGASGDIGPRDGYVGDVAVAARNGRELGFAALATLQSIPPPLTRMDYLGPVVSGATIGTWDHRPIADRRATSLELWRSERITVSLEIRPGVLDQDRWQRELSEWQARESAAQQAGKAEEQRTARAMTERARRRLTRCTSLPPSGHVPFQLTATRMGDAIWLELNGEHYNLLQREIRTRFPDIPVLVGTLANGSEVWYVLNEASYGLGLYQEEASILAAGSLEKLIDEITTLLHKLSAAAT